MRIDFGTLAFGYKLLSGGGTPNWATSLGQGKEYKINNNTDMDEIIKGILYTSVPLSKVKIKTAWGTDITPLFDNHISYISEVNNDNDNRGISIDEADYILKILKDEKVNKIIINSQDSRSISSRLPIKIELYDKKNSKG